MPMQNEPCLQKPPPTPFYLPFQSFIDATYHVTASISINSASEQEKP